MLITEVSEYFGSGFCFRRASLSSSEIAFQNNDLTFKYASPFYQNSEYLQYSSFLEGYDKNWSDWSKNTEKSYTNLPFGDYVFKVKSKNDFDNQSEIAEYSFTIKPPWFATAWAILSYFYTSRIFHLVDYLYSFGSTEERTNSSRKNCGRKNRRNQKTSGRNQ